MPESICFCRLRQRLQQRFAVSADQQLDTVSDGVAEHPREIKLRLWMQACLRFFDEDGAVSGSTEHLRNDG